MSTLRVNNITDTSGGSSSLSVPGAAKAWVNFNGTGTVAIRAQLNVSSITDNGTGDYTVNFSSALTDANYAATALGSRQANTGPWIVTQEGTAPTTSAVRVRNRNGSMNLEDCEGLNVSIFR